MQAFTYYKKAAELDRQNNIAFYDLGRLYEDVYGEHEIAISLVRKSIEIKADYAPAYYLLGKAYENIDDHNNSKASFKKYLELDPNGQFADFIKSYLLRNN